MCSAQSLDYWKRCRVLIQITWEWVFLCGTQRTLLATLTIIQLFLCMGSYYKHQEPNGPLWLGVGRDTSAFSITPTTTSTTLANTASIPMHGLVLNGLSWLTCYCTLSSHLLSLVKNYNFGLRVWALKERGVKVLKGKQVSIEFGKHGRLTLYLTICEGLAFKVKQFPPINLNTLSKLTLSESK